MIYAETKEEKNHPPHQRVVPIRKEDTFYPRTLWRRKDKSKPRSIPERRSTYSHTLVNPLITFMLFSPSRRGEGGSRGVVIGSVCEQKESGLKGRRFIIGDGME